MTARRLGIALLGLWTAAQAWLLASGTVTAYLRPGLWPVVLLGAVLSAAFVAGLVLRPPGHDPGHQTAWLRTAVLALPLLYLVAGHGRTLGSYAFGKRAVDPLGRLPAAGGAADGEIEAERPSLLRVLRRATALEGKTVRTLGQVTRGHGEPAGHFVLFRFVITCCVADARPVGLLVRDDGGWPADAWVDVEGVLERTSVGGRPAWCLVPGRIEATEAPESPYLYGF